MHERQFQYSDGGATRTSRGGAAGEVDGARRQVWRRRQRPPELQQRRRPAQCQHPALRTCTSTSLSRDAATRSQPGFCATQQLQTVCRHVHTAAARALDTYTCLYLAAVALVTPGLLATSEWSPSDLRRRPASPAATPAALRAARSHAPAAASPPHPTRLSAAAPGSRSPAHLRHAQMSVNRMLLVWQGG